MAALAAGLALALGHASTSAGAEPTTPRAIVPPEPLPSTILERGDARAWRVELRGRLSPVHAQGGGLALSTCEFVLPFVQRGPTSVLDTDALYAELSTVDRGPSLPVWTGFKDERSPFEGVSASVVATRVEARELYLRFRGTAVCYATRIDDRLALDAAWPEEWPAEVGRALLLDDLPEVMPAFGRPNAYEQAVLGNVLQGGDPRSWAPYTLAKAIVRQCVVQFRWSESFRSAEQRRSRAESGWWFEMERRVPPINGVLEDSPLALTLHTVQALRMAGLPARPVFGLGRDRQGPFHAVWGEFYLHGPGWIPFDPIELRSNGVQGLQFDQAWRGFGHLPDHNRRLPLAYEPRGVGGAGQRADAPTGNISVWRAEMDEARRRPARLELNWSMTSVPLP